VNHGDPLSVDFEIAEHAATRDAAALRVSKQSHPILIGVSPDKGDVDVGDGIQHVPASNVAAMQYELSAALAQNVSGSLHGISAPFRVAYNACEHFLEAGF
jgi:hypothetical protein